MTDIIIHKHSITAGDAPEPAELNLGELAIQAADGHIYLKKTDGTVNRVTMLPGGTQQQVLYKTGAGNYALGWGTITSTLMGGALWNEVVAEVQRVFELVEGTASVLLTAPATLTAGSTGPITVSVADSSYLTDGTSITGVLGTVYGTLSRSGSTYSFVSNQSYTSDVNFATGTRFAAAFLNDTFNPLRIGSAEIQDDASYTDGSGYSQAVVDSSGRVGYGYKDDGTFDVPSGNINLDDAKIQDAGSYTDGSGYARVEVDENGRIAWGIKSDGTVAIKKALFVGNSSSEENAFYAEGTGYYQVVLDSTGRVGYGLKDDGSFDINGGITTKKDTSYPDETYSKVEVDSANRITHAIRPSGEHYFPKAEIDTLTVNNLSLSTPVSSMGVVSTSNSLFESKLVNSELQIFSTNSYATQQLTNIGDNHDIALTTETPERLLFKSTRTGETVVHVMDQDGSDLALAIPPKNLVLWGDSMTAGLGSTRVADALGDGRRVVAKGYGGRRSVFIAARQGGFPVTGDIANSQIPASGAVAVSNFYPTEVLDSSYQSLSCTVNGLAGTLNYNGGSWTFTRATAGSVVAVTNPVTFEPTLDDTVGDVVYNFNEYTSVLWLGRNGVGGTQGETDVSVYQGVIAKFRNLFKRLIILPIFNGGYSTESDGDTNIPTTSTAGYNSIVGRNGNIATAYPDLFYDVRRDFIDGAEAWLQTNYSAAYALDWTRSFYQIGSGAVSGRPTTANNGDIWDDSGTKTIYDTTTSSWLSYTGLARTAANLGPDSSWDVANDVPPRAMRYDQIHLNSYGNEFLAELLATKIQSLGW